MFKAKKRGRGGLVLLLAAAMLIYALVYSNTEVFAKSYTLYFDSLPASFDGFTAAVVADCHGRFDSRIADAVGDARPNVVLLVGDLIDDAGQLEDGVAFARVLTDIAPVYFVTGNHEWACGAAAALKSGLEGAGVTVLDNTVVTLGVGTEYIYLAGLADPNGPADMPVPAQVLAGAGDAFTLLLSHRPFDFESYAGLGAELVVSGHMHGGLVRVPFVGGLLSPGGGFFPEYDGGAFFAGGSAMVVSRGLAGVNDFPRLFNPREVSVVVLRRGTNK